MHITLSRDNTCHDNFRNNWCRNTVVMMKIRSIKKRLTKKIILIDVQTLQIRTKITPPTCLILIQAELRFIKRYITITQSTCLHRSPFKKRIVFLCTVVCQINYNETHNCWNTKKFIVDVLCIKAQTYITLFEKKKW